jgi:uncharacterized protein (DUF362 family)
LAAPAGRPHRVNRPNRRNLVLAGVGSACTAGFALDRMRGPGDRRTLSDRGGNSSPVVVVRCGSYSAELARRIVEGINECRLNVKGKRVLLKPNLVEFDRNTVINTDVSVVAAAYEAFSSLGAAQVLIGEGPGHRRDAYSIAEQAGYRGLLTKFDSRFVDLNRDDVSPVAGFAGEPRFYFPNTALQADLIVSIPKMKTHHWAGATLAMKNFFGLVPGAVYGWPKNTLHMIGISRSIVELNRVFSKTFAIVDGIVGMEGNGPIQGSPKPAGVLVMGADLRAVDATCCRVMGIDPARVNYIEASAHLGNATERGIEQRGERLAHVRTNFRLVREFEDLRLAL